MSIPAGGHHAFWTLALNSAQATTAEWLPADEPTTAGDRWGDRRGLQLEVSVAVTDGAAEFKIDGNGTWAPLVSGMTLTTGAVSSLQLRTADDGTAAAVLVAAKYA